MPTIAKKDDFLVFAVDIHFSKPFQASFTSSSRESGNKNSRLDDKLDSRVDDIGMFCHGFCFWSLIWGQRVTSTEEL